MVALAEGTKAPDFELKTLAGAAHKISEQLKTSEHVIVAFYKASCPVCQLAFPFLERIHESTASKGASAPLWGVSQDDSQETEGFIKEYGITFPVLLDEELKSTVAFGLTNVPSIFVINRDMMIVDSIVGFSKQDLEKIYSLLGGDSEKSPLFTSSDDVPDFRPG